MTGPERGKPDAPRRGNTWSVVALLCSLCVVCPPLTLLGPVLGVAALLAARRHPQRGGRRAAIWAIALGLAVSAGWAAGARWWHVHVRRPMIDGPRIALQAGLDGDISAFVSAFDVSESPEAIEEARAFLREVRRRYGTLRRMTQHDQAAPPARPTILRPVIPYQLTFEHQSVTASAEFVLLAQGRRGLVLKFAWICLEDPVQGDLSYPVSADMTGRPGALTDDK